MEFCSYTSRASTAAACASDMAMNAHTHFDLGHAILGDVVVFEAAGLYPCLSANPPSSGRYDGPPRREDRCFV